MRKRGGAVSILWRADNGATKTVAQKCNFRASIFTSLLALFRLSLLALRAFCSSLLALFSPPVFRTCILEFFGLLFSRFLDFSPRAFFADSACRNVCESPMTQDHGDLASGLQVVLK